MGSHYFHEEYQLYTKNYKIGAWLALFLFYIPMYIDVPMAAWKELNSESINVDQKAKAAANYC